MLIALAMVVEMVAVKEHSQRVLKVVTGIGVGAVVTMRMTGKWRSFVVNEAKERKYLVNKLEETTHTKTGPKEFSNTKARQHYLNHYSVTNFEMGALL